MAEREEDFEDAAYSRWLNSPDWLELVAPFIEEKIQSLYREFSVADVRDGSGVAIIQGGILALEYVLNAPRRHFDRRKLNEEEENETEFADRPGRSEPRRFITYGTRGR